MWGSSVRFVAGIALGLSLGGAWACREQGFACGVDADCSLAGVPGFCQVDGNCAYVDADCEGGLRYPVGAPGQLSDRCVDASGPPSTTSEGASDETDSDGGATDEEEGAATHASTTEYDDTTEGEMSEWCTQEATEPNDSLLESTLTTPRDCSFTVEGAVGGDDDFDFYIAPVGFARSALCESRWEIRPEATGIETCLIARCLLGEFPRMSCPFGAELLASGWMQCCGSGDFSTAVECSESLSQLGLRVRGYGECVPYSVSVSASD